jgi:ariadne-2
MIVLGNDIDDIDSVDPKKTDPEFFKYDCLTVDEVEKLLNESVEGLSNSLKIVPSLAKVLLHEHRWNANEIIERYRDNASNLLVSSRIKSGNGKKVTQATLLCPVCIQTLPFEKFQNLSCAHSFCKGCWSMHFEIQVAQGISTQIRCMANECDVLVPEDLVLNLVSRPQIRDKYQQFAFQDYVKSHPELRFCPGKIAIQF